MRVKESEQLMKLATACGKTANQVSETIISELVKKQIIEETPENFGEVIGNCIKRDIFVSEIVSVIQAIGVSTVKSADYENFVECVLIGSDDCPECGGKMVVVDGEDKYIGGDGYNTPFEYAPIWEDKICSHCGHRESNEPNIN